MKKKGAVKGETTTLSYTPGERLAESRPPDEGIYQFALSKMGKPFPKGWKAKPGKFPNRMVLWKVLDTEDEVSGKEKEVAEFISLSPGALRHGAMRLAQAAQYPLQLEIVKNDKATNHPSVRKNAIAIDKMLLAIKDQEMPLRGDLSHETYQGEAKGRVKWLPPEELDEETEGGGDEDMEDEDGGAFGGGDEDEDEAPKKGKKKASEDEEEDEEAEAEEETDSDDEEEADEDSEDEDEEAEEADDEDESDDEEESDEDEDSDDDDELSDEAIEELSKKPKAGKKVKQGPAKGGAPAKKKVVTKKKSKK